MPAGCPIFLPAWADPSRPMDSSGWRKSWRAVVELADELEGLGLAGDRQVVPYCLRHTVINSHSEAGVDFADVADFSGPEGRKRGTTHLYRHSDVPRLVRVGQALEDYLERGV